MLTPSDLAGLCTGLAALAMIKKRTARDRQLEDF